MDRSRRARARVRAVLSTLSALVAIALWALPAGCSKEAEVECSTLDAAGNPVPGASAEGPSGKGVGNAPCAKTKDCPRSCICRDLGRCKTGADGACEVGTEEDCRKSRICRMKGFCTLHGRACVAGSDEDCAKSDSCKRLSACKAYGGLCVEAPPK